MAVNILLDLIENVNTWDKLEKKITCLQQQDKSLCEVIWKEKSAGQFIPYSDASRLTEL